MPPSATPTLRIAPRSGLSVGYNPITRFDDVVPRADFALGIEFGIRVFAANETLVDSSPHETVWILLHGEVTFEAGNVHTTTRRDSIFDQPPTALNVSAGTAVSLKAGSNGCELAVARTANSAVFTPRLYRPADLQPEYRGTGLVQNACQRNVRLIFDRTTRPESNFVLGEVVNYPGRWSSYPPHHHAQPEIYHYRFTAPAGYGHAELGEEVVKVRHGDTTVIPPGLDHAQVSAPGYGMYYLWLIRHLPNDPYTGFTFTPEHQWTLDAAQQGWQPKDSPPGLV